MVTRAIELFWDEKRGLFADNPSRKTFSEHAQCFAVLSSALDADRMKRIEQGLLNDPDLARATIYFRHYLFETYRVFGRMEAIEDRLTMWYGLKEQGFKTAPEMPEPSRSDCHAWSAHPIYHAYASFLGIRPGGFGFDRVRISPQLGSMKEAKASMVHPKGRIEVALQQAGPGLKANVTLPAGVNGEFVYAGKSRELRPGENSFEV
jgi:alpha-L-rhamnosidase